MDIYVVRGRKDKKENKNETVFLVLVFQWHGSSAIASEITVNATAYSIACSC